jgi:hypothetical protein
MVVTYSFVLHLLGLSSLERHAVALVLEALGGDQSLDLRGLGVWLLALSLRSDLSPDDVLSDLEPRNNAILAICNSCFSSRPTGSLSPAMRRKTSRPSHTLPGLYCRPTASPGRR